MAIFTEDKIEIGGATARIHAAGRGKAVVYLGPVPLPDSVSALAEGAHVTAIDAKHIAGEGGARTLAAAIAKLGIETFGVVAAPDRAPLALWLALVAPEAVDAVVIIAPSVLDAAGTGADSALVSRLNEVKPQVLALFGTKDTGSPPQLGAVYRKALPACHIVFVYDAGHDIEAERPAAAAAVARAFLERREQFVVNTRSSKLYP